MEEKPKRLAPKPETIRLILTRSGNQCAYPGCTHTIFNDINELVAECCHIEAALPGGERFNPNQSNKDRRSYQNLLFLCHAHHVETNDVTTFPVERLKEIKADHERKFKEQIFEINSNYISQVIDLFNTVQNDVKETLEITKRIEANQHHIYDLLDKSRTENNLKETYDDIYLGEPAITGFVGRKNELNQLSESYPKYNTFQIVGISGIGKSSLVSKFISIFEADTCIWIDCEMVDSIERLNHIIGNYLEQNFNEPKLQSAKKDLSKDGILIAIIKAIEKYSLCIVFDSINSCSHGLYFTIDKFNNYLRNCKLIYTTTLDIRSTNWPNPVFSLNLRGLDFLSFQKLNSNTNFDLSEKQLFEIHDLLGGHPYLLKLVFSILEYCPVNVFLGDLRDRQNDDISDYIKTKIYDNLTKIEIEQLQFLTLIEIPFRFEILDFFDQNNKRKTFHILQKKSLIVNQPKDYFSIPEFIRSYLEKYFPSIDKAKIYILSYTYLDSLGNKKHLFEWIRIIHIGLLAGLSNDVYDKAKMLISSLMNLGYFSIAYNLCEELKRNKASKGWDFIYFISGRILRFNNDYEKALQVYENALGLDEIEIPRAALKFELASVFTYLSVGENKQHYYDKAIQIYEELSKSEDSNIAFQSLITLANDLIRKGQFSDSIDNLKSILENRLNESIDPGILASFWQIFGTAYSGIEEYQNAIDCFEKSFTFYHEAIESHGMNTIEGLYNAYQELAWTYSKGGLLHDAVQMFGIASDLSRNFGFTEKLERSLFDYGYHLILIEEYKESAKVLSYHYDILHSNNWFEESDMFLIYSALTFSHWYAGMLEDAIQLLGLFIIESSKRNNRPPVTIIEFNSLNEKIDTIHWFNKRALILILPEGKTFNDFNQLVSDVVNIKPELNNVLSSFITLKRDSTN